MPLYKEEFIKDGGYRFFRRNKSLLVQAISYGRVLSHEQNLAYLRRITEYLNAISGSPPPPTTGYSISELAPTYDNFPNVIDQPYYKYVREDVWERNKSGSFRLGTSSFYRSTTDTNISDYREGTGTFHLIHGNNQLNVSIISGFNGALYCGTGTIGDRTLMSTRFGKVLIKIYPVKEFAARIANFIHAARFHIYDVVYFDPKSFIVNYKNVRDFHNIVMQKPDGDLTPQSLHSLNKRFFDLFHTIGLMPSLFSKLVSYAPEQERRIVFEFGADLKTETTMIQDSSLLDFIEII